ncbi:hypothetical protein OTK49_01960 [Vibrio coralliirubri]|uniref:hypothetical protein n=1 Tax=Vibrio coralliirubri TaxID=1516159 RepID=UPI002283FE39|nr:hypothetical protein [Vibrio coralliirubri]MCY9861279.1 hypothetical protein [Vibrio coralliirubri]
MDIRSTITQELAEDVSNLLQDYLRKAEPSVKDKFVNTASAILSGIESRITDNAKWNITKTGAYAMGALGLMTFGYSLADAITIDHYYDQATYETQAMGMLAAGGMFLSSIVLFEQLKKSTEPEPAPKQESFSSDVIPAEVRQLINMVGKGNINDHEKLIEALNQMPKATVEAVKEFAWINANREQIKNGAAPIDHQYDSKPATLPRMRM